jgi:hypothetical protein
MAGIPDLIRKYKLSGPTQLSEQTVTDPDDRRILAVIARRKARRHTRVLCLSGDWANELMWAFYADNHCGLCLCFNTEHEFFQNAKPVLYTHSPVDVEHLVDSQAQVDHVAYCKSLAWQFQKEWRIVLPGDEPKKVEFPRVILGHRFPESYFDGLKQVLIKGGYCVDILRAERIPNSYEFGLIKLGQIG